jgi:hypothetical protein
MFDCPRQTDYFTISFGNFTIFLAILTIFEVPIENPHTNRPSRRSVRKSAYKPASQSRQKSAYGFRQPKQTSQGTFGGPGISKLLARRAEPVNGTIIYLYRLRAMRALRATTHKNSVYARSPRAVDAQFPISRPHISWHPLCTHAVHANSIYDLRATDMW